MPQTQTAPPKSIPRVAMPEGRLATSDPEVARMIDLEVDNAALVGRGGGRHEGAGYAVTPPITEMMNTDSSASSLIMRI